MTNYRDEPPNGGDWVFSRYITVKGRRIYRPNGGVFRFPAKGRRSRP